MTEFLSMDGVIIDITIYIYIWLTVCRLNTWTNFEQSNQFGRSKTIMFHSREGATSIVSMTLHL